MLKFIKIKGNKIHSTAIINWKNVTLGKNNIIGGIKDKDVVQKIIFLTWITPSLRIELYNSPNLETH